MADEVYTDEFSGFAEGYDVDAAAERMKHGGLVPPGKYPATLTGAKKTESKKKGTPGWELTFTISTGPFTGSEVTDTLYITDNSKSRDRLALFGHRLGLLERTKDGKGLVKIAGKTDLIDCLDVATVIEVIHEPDQNDKDKKWVRLAFGGVHDPKDPKVREELARGNRPDASGGAAGAGAKKPDPTPPTKPRATARNL